MAKVKSKKEEEHFEEEHVHGEDCDHDHDHSHEEESEKFKMGTLNLRRLRSSSLVRGFVRSVDLSHKQFIQPYFVAEGLKKPQVIPSLTGVYRETTDSLLRQIEKDMKAGVRAGLLFGVPEKKIKARQEKSGEVSFDLDINFTCLQIQKIKQTFGKDFWLAADVCFCSYTDHGHCGILNHAGNQLLNSETVEALMFTAYHFAEAGADCVAPSDMMDGRIGVIRQTLDKNGLDDRLLMSYAVKFHSRFYGPFRVAADSAPKKSAQAVLLTDRATYQIDPGAANDALQCAKRDTAEGADIIMVKPGLPYLDIIHQLKDVTPKPIAAYEVSGEYGAIELMAKEGLMQGPQAHVESWTGLRRAGAQIIISYGARHAKTWIEEYL